MYRQSEKNLLNIDTSSTCPRNMVNFGLLTANICWRVWDTPVDFNGFRVLACNVTARHSSSGRQCGVEQRAPPIFGRATITLGIGPHCSYFIFADNATTFKLLSGDKFPQVDATTASSVPHAQRDGRPAECRWRPLFNAAKFG